MDYQKELENFPEASPDEKAELQKLATMQKDIAIGGSAEDFVRHPFFKFFENQMNAIIADSKNEMAELLKRPETTIGDIKAHQAGIEKIAELKRWINAKVIAKRVAEQAISMYEQDTEKMNEKIQAAVDKQHE